MEQHRYDNRIKTFFESLKREDRDRAPAFSTLIRPRTRTGGIGVWVPAVCALTLVLLLGVGRRGESDRIVPTTVDWQEPTQSLLVLDLVGPAGRSGHFPSDVLGLNSTFSVERLRPLREE